MSLFSLFVKCDSETLHVFPLFEAMFRQFKQGLNLIWKSYWLGLDKVLS